MSDFAHDFEQTIKRQAWRLQAHIVHASNPAGLIQTLNENLTASFSRLDTEELRLSRAGLKPLQQSQWGLEAQADEVVGVSPQWDGMCEVEGNRAQLDAWLRPQFVAWAQAIGEHHPEAMVMLSAGTSSSTVTLALRVAAGACLVLPQAMQVTEHHPMLLVHEETLVSSGMSRVLMEVYLPSPTMLALARKLAQKDLWPAFQSAQAWLKAQSLGAAFQTDVDSPRTPRM